MNIQIVCSDVSHPNYGRLERWCETQRPEHDVTLVTQSDRLTRGDLLFLISCSEFIQSEVRDRFRHALVVHASAVPEGRGWSPHVWQILNGSNVIPVTLLEAESSVDTGRVWAREKMVLEGHELYDEINDKLFVVTVRLMSFAIGQIDAIEPVDQAGEPASYFEKRSPADSKLDPERSIADQFELMRVADPDRFPCFFDYRGCTYTLVIRKRGSK